MSKTIVLMARSLRASSAFTTVSIAVSMALAVSGAVPVRTVAATKLSVSRSTACAAAEPDEHLTAWRNRPVGEINHLNLDAGQEEVPRDGNVLSCALLTAIGIGSARQADDPRVQRAGAAEAHWRRVLESLRDRGVRGPKLVVSDIHSRRRATGQAVFPGVPWQRGQAHVIQSAMAHVPRVAMSSLVAADLRDVFDADGAVKAVRRQHDVVARYRKPAMTPAAFGDSDRIGVGREHRVLRCVATASTRQSSNRRTN